MSFSNGIPEVKVLLKDIYELLNGFQNVPQIENNEKSRI